MKDETFEFIHGVAVIFLISMGLLMINIILTPVWIIKWMVEHFVEIITV